MVMSEPTTSNSVKRPVGPAPLVEDTQSVGGVDEATGAPVIRPRTPDGKADAQTVPTDPREQ
jgi:hypothetical protein